MILKENKIFRKMFKVTECAALSSVLEEFFVSFHDFWVQKYKNKLFEENKRFECSFSRIQVQVIANQPSRLEKTTNT